MVQQGLFWHIWGCYGADRTEEGYRSSCAAQTTLQHLLCSTRLISCTTHTHKETPAQDEITQCKYLEFSRQHRCGAVCGIVRFPRTVLSLCRCCYYQQAEGSPCSPRTGLGGRGPNLTQPFALELVNLQLQFLWTTPTWFKNTLWISLGSNFQLNLQILTSGFLFPKSLSENSCSNQVLLPNNFDFHLQISLGDTGNNNCRHKPSWSIP